MEECRNIDSDLIFRSWSVEWDCLYTLGVGCALDYNTYKHNRQEIISGWQSCQEKLDWSQIESAVNRSLQLANYGVLLTFLVFSLSERTNSRRRKSYWEMSLLTLVRSTEIVGPRAGRPLSSKETWLGLTLSNEEGTPVTLLYNLSTFTFYCGRPQAIIPSGFPLPSN